MASRISKFRDLKHPGLHYITYVLTFPDGEVWIKQRPFNDLAWELKQQITEKKDSVWKSRMYALWRAGECWWKDAMNVEHLMLLENRKRKDRWGVTTKGFIETDVKDPGLDHKNLEGI